MQRRFLTLLTAFTLLAWQSYFLPAQDSTNAQESNTEPEAKVNDTVVNDTVVNDSEAKITEVNDAETNDQVVPASDAVGTAQAEWAEIFEQWKGILVSLREIETEYQLAEPDAMAGLQERWTAKINEGRQLIPDVRTAAVAAQREAPNSDRELTRFLIKMMEDEIANDNYEPADELGQALLETNMEDQDIQNLAGIAAFAMNDFERALELLESAAGTDTLSSAGQSILTNLREHADLAELWQQEQVLRAAEAEAPEAEQLPQVKMETTAGDFVLELFENEAPETVGNFVNLVEKGYYDNLTFHRVMPAFMAQGGCPQGDGSGGPGYKIYCECIADSHRNHWRGSISMAKTAARNTGGSQFFFNFVSTPHLNGQHTVFGRIVEGTENLSKILKRDPSDPNQPATKIIKAEVLRKRDHDYVPNKVQ